MGLKVIWIVNIMLPDVNTSLGTKVLPLGGWLTGYKNALLALQPDIELYIIAPFEGKAPRVIQTECNNKGSVLHYLFPSSWMHKKKVVSSSICKSKSGDLLTSYFLGIYNQVRPDVVHVHGTEMPHSYVWVESCGTAHTIVSLQGLTHVYSRYYMGGLTIRDLRGCWSINDCFFCRSLFQEQQKQEQQGVLEQKLLKKVQNVAGRTSWDYMHSWAINPQAKYYKLQEPLRPVFYNELYHWTLAACSRHRIFVSQSHYPIKGLHVLLQALPIVLLYYPDTQLYVVGEDRIDQHWRHRSTYVNLLRKLIYKFGLRNHVNYLGILSEHQMAEQLLLAHVFVCPSAIENSCNSLCEAQMLGTPVVASCVGGLIDLVDHGTTGLLYRFEEFEMLANEICHIFGNDDLATRLSLEERKKALVRHDRDEIARTLYSIYQWI